MERYRSYTGWTSLIIRIIEIAVPFLALIYIFDVPRRYLNHLLYPSQYAAIFLVLILILIFLLVPAAKDSAENKPAWYDILLITLSVAVCLYVFIEFPSRFKLEKIDTTKIEQALFLVTLGVLTEAIRRTIGWPVLILGFVFLLHAKFAYLLPGLLGGPPYSLSDLASYIYLSPWGLFGPILEIAATIIIVFLIFGTFLHEAGAGNFFTDFALSMTGHMRGGPAKVAVISSALFGTISGSPIANVGTTGAISIPLMKRIGYKPHFAAAVESISSTGGAIMPPMMGAVGFIMAEYTQMGYTAVCIAAVVPAILYFVCVFFQLDFESAKLGLRGLPRNELPLFTKTLKEGYLFFIPLIVLVVLLMILQYDPLESVTYSIIVLVLVSWLNKKERMGIKKIFNGLAEGTRGILLIGPVCAFVGTITGSVSLTGLGINLSSILVDFSGGSLILLALLSGVAIYFMGMGIGVIISYIILAIIVAPAMVNMGVPVMVAHMFIFYMGCSMFFTPPNCPVVFVAAGIAGSNIFKTGFAAMKLGIICYLIPFVILYNPALILMGKTSEIVLAVATSLLGAVSLAAGIEGYVVKKINWFDRVLFLGGGLCFFVPGWVTDVAGLAIIALPVIRQCKISKSNG
ncbi:MAG: TRAP transporter fused permease subunit [Desulfobacterales bacterium]|nr:TRAP transporter fused permease subunit [Desulfobacterales bacterium]